MSRCPHPRWPLRRDGRSPVRLGLLVALSILPLTAAPAPRVADLGGGLQYFRVHAVPGELPAAAPKPAPNIVDLRNCQLASGSAAAWEAWLRFRAAPTAPLLLLVNGRTAPELAAVLAANRALPGVLIIGLPAPGLTPDIAVPASADDDQRAYEAAEQGTSLATLLSSGPDKLRSDEAAIVRERSHSPDDDGADEEAGDGPPAGPAGEAAKPPAIVDATLLKAIQMHRTLRALQRL